MSEQAPREYHPVIEENFVTEGTDMGRMKNTDLAYDLAETEGRYQDDYKGFMEQHRENLNKYEEARLIETAINGQPRTNVARAIGRHKAYAKLGDHAALDTLEEIYNNARSEASEVDYSLRDFRNVVAKENSRLLTEARKKGL